MATVKVLDHLKAAVEAASGGEQTIIYTAKGQPCYMNVIKSFGGLSIDASIGGSVHPAFTVGGVNKSQFLIGTYPAALVDGELVSQPNLEPVGSTLFANMFAAAKACGAGFHVATATEYAAIALLAWKAGKVPKGNTYYGRSAVDATQYGRRADGLSATEGITTGNPKILTGSGPVSFRHLQNYNGISDLVGNSQEWAPGIRLVNTELQFLQNNNAASATSLDQIYTAGGWKALDATNGNFIDPVGDGATPNAVKLALSSNASHPKENALILGWASTPITSITNSSAQPISEAALKVLKLYGILPINNTNVQGTLDISSGLDRTAYLTRGGSYVNSNAGLQSINLFNRYDQHQENLLGCRLAYIA